MKKKICLIPYLLLLPLLLPAQKGSAECSAFKKGNFAYRDSSTNTIREFKRTKSHQVETDKRTGLSTRYRIEWISDCEYKLTQVYANKKEARKMNNSWLVYKIISTTGSSYTYQCTCSDRSEKQGTVVKMQ